MPRKITEYYDEMIAEKNTMSNLSVYQPNIDSSQTLLNDLTTSSKVDRWRLLFWCMAVCAWSIDAVAELRIAAMKLIAANSRYGTIPWYNVIAKEYQHGDALTQVNLEYVYNPVDFSHRVVQLASARAGTGLVVIKSAKIVTGVAQKLSDAEFTGFKGYMNKRKPAGIKLNFINEDPDDLKLELIVWYDPLVLKNTGESIADPGVFPVQNAIDDYLKFFQSDEGFNSGYELMRQIDFIQSAAGVASAYVSAAYARYGVLPFTQFAYRYYPNAGYLKLHVDSSISYFSV